MTTRHFHISAIFVVAVCLLFNACQGHVGQVTKKSNPDELYYQGVAFLDVKQYDRAIDAFSMVLEMNPTHANAYHNRGRVWNRKGQYDKAVADFTKTINIEPHALNSYWGRGWALTGKGDYEGAITDYNKALEMNPRHVNIYFDRALTWLLKGEYMKACMDFAKATEIDPYKARPMHDEFVKNIRAKYFP